jgi:uncharacterized membrane protein YhaH (DUF805 family)
MLPFENRPWAKKVALSVILFSLLAAAIAVIVLDRTKGLDTGAVTAIFLILLAIIPPNIAVLRHRRLADGQRRATMVPSHTSIR